MNFHILTLFPEMIDNAMSESVIGRAVKTGAISIETTNIRDFANNKHNKVDDYTYGGGAGMLLQAQPVFDAYKSVAAAIKGGENAGIIGGENTSGNACIIGGENVNGNAINGDAKMPRCIYVTPQGKTFNQRMAKELSMEKDLIILCGHYEGIDDRVLDEIVTDYVSIGDYVLTGGELAAMIIVDAVSRLVPAVLGNEDSSDMESFRGNLLEYPQYSRPEVWHDKKVPEVLLSGNAKKIEEWRLEQSIQRTKERRPDLYEAYQSDMACVERWLKADKRSYIDMIENVRRGLSKLIYDGPGGQIIYNESNKTAMAAIMDEDVDTLISHIPNEAKSLVVHSDSFEEHEPLFEKASFKTDSKFYSYVYTVKEQAPCRLPKEFLGRAFVKCLDESFTRVIADDYKYEGDEYIRRHLSYGKIYGLFVDDELAAYVGTHDEGTMGMLYVFEKYRHKGLARYMEGFIINKHKEYGYTPFCRVEEGNIASETLQESLGLFKSKQKAVWMCR